MADEQRIFNRDLEVLDRVSSGKDIYCYVCAHGTEVISAAAHGAEAIRFKQRLEENLKYWEEADERNVSVLSQDAQEVHRTQGSLL